jgi:hypothetical protein
MAEVVAFIVIAALIALPVLGLWLHFREKRIARETGRKDGGQASSLARAGLMEVQSLLEPERKIEVVREEERKRDLLADVHEEGDKDR